MAKMTLLEIVQDVLNDMDSDVVNSISDTIESQQVAQIVKTTYEEILSYRLWPHTQSLFTLDASGDNTKPNFMKLPVDVSEITELRYNKRDIDDTHDRWEEVIWMDQVEFLDLVNARKNSDIDVSIITGPSGLSLNIINDHSPTYYTTFDDEWIAFDSYDSAVDNTLQESKTQCYGYIEPPFVLSDTFIPDMPAKAFAYLLSEAKSVAFNALRQQPNAKEEQRSKRQRMWLSREKWRKNSGIKFPDYGRK